jgi:large conductance mechanosensitive channel
VNFLDRGNALMIAVGVGIGYVFAQLAIGVAQGLLAPVIGAILDIDDFKNAAFTINGNDFQYGNIVTVLIALVLAVATVYFALGKLRRA